MSSPRRNARLQRNVLLCLAVASFLASLAAGLQPWLALTIRQAFYDTSAPMFLGLVAPFSVFFFVAGGPARSQRRWCGHDGGVTFMLVGVFCVDAFCAVLAWLACWLAGNDASDSVIPVPAGILLCIAVELVLIALINWSFLDGFLRRGGSTPSER